MEATSTDFIIYIPVESVSPIDSHHAEHGQEDAHSDTGRSFEIERIVVFDFVETVSGFQKCKQINGCGLFQWKRIPQFQGKFVV